MLAHNYNVNKIKTLVSMQDPQKCDFREIFACNPLLSVPDTD